LCITSSATVEESESEDIIVKTTKVEGTKCPICWKINKNECERHPRLNSYTDEQN